MQNLHYFHSVDDGAGAFQLLGFSKQGNTEVEASAQGNYGNLKFNCNANKGAAFPESGSK